MMEAEKLVLLLDIDGVLLESHGYRLACIDTINHMIAEMGQPRLSINRTVTDAFEAAGIKAEWDMIPLILAAFTNYCLSKNSMIISGESFPPVLGGRRLVDRESFMAMLRKQALEFGRCIDPDLSVMDSIYAAYKNGTGKGLDVLRENRLFKSFFTDTLDPVKCPFFAELENRLLGKQIYEEFYGLPAPVDCGSYLAEKDVPLISDRYKELLTKITDKSPVYPVVMTYRPTRMPAIPDGDRSLYFVNTPEGECAMTLLGWDGGRMKMIGSGSLCYAEAKQGLRREYYTKPHPFHGIASVLYAICGDEMKALDLAARLCGDSPEQEKFPAEEFLKKDDSIRIAVFEDSASGISCAENTALLLRKWGIDAEAILCGIRTIPEKDALLSYSGAVLYDNVNTALDYVLEKYAGLRL